MKLVKTKNGKYKILESKMELDKDYTIGKDGALVVYYKESNGKKYFTYNKMLHKDYSKKLEPNGKFIDEQDVWDIENTVRHSSYFKSDFNTTENKIGYKIWKEIQNILKKYYLKNTCNEIIKIINKTLDDYYLSEDDAMKMIDDYWDKTYNLDSPELEAIKVLNGKNAGEFRIIIMTKDEDDFYLVNDLPVKNGKITRLDPSISVEDTRSKGLAAFNKVK